MKMSNQIKLFAAAIVLLAMSSCAKDKGPADESSEYGTLDLGSITHSVVETRASDTDAFAVKVWRILPDGETLAIDRPYSECTGEVLLPVGQYRLEVSSGELQPAAFEAPWYVGRVGQFPIVKDTPASIGNVVCSLGNVKVTVGYSAGFREAVDPASVSMTVTVGGNTLPYSYGETAAGYFSADGQTDMTLDFDGVVSGEPVAASRTVKVSPGEWHKLRLVLDENGALAITLYDNEIGEIGDGDNWGAF